MNVDAKTLTEAVERMIDLNAQVPAIGAEFIARGAMGIIGFAYELHHAGWYGCEQHLRQLARSALRGRFDPAERAKAIVAGDVQEDLFPETLQERYPRAHHNGDDFEYVKRTHLSEGDYVYNVARMRRVATSLQRHANTLEAEQFEKFGRPNAA